uniref:Uncharacterized protein n=1 Tax=Aegilops tauschii subsp. strangulata TaxID=200361 RepID=A0A453MGZ1_AEGTS
PLPPLGFQARRPERASGRVGVRPAAAGGCGGGGRELAAAAGVQWPGDSMRHWLCCNGQSGDDDRHEVEHSKAQGNKIDGSFMYLCV